MMVISSVRALNRHSFVEQTTMILYCRGKSKTADAGETTVPYSKSNFPCKISPEIFIGIQSSSDKAILDKDCNLDLQRKVSRTFDFLLLSYNKSTVLLSNSTTQTFLNDANCFTRLAAKWFTEEVSIDSFHCGSADPGLRHLI
eukprot:m.54197 g.54197  ORF g.54197 m.54197 type:complete len:143 (+) comp34336_c0_seq1:38-466(+)